MTDFRGIILTGTMCSGKTEIARELVRKNPKFVLPRIITTCEDRQNENNQYICIDEMNFDAFNNTYYISFVHETGKYAYSLPDILRNNEEGKYNVLILPPEVYANMMEEEKHGNRKEYYTVENFISFFVDVDGTKLADHVSTSISSTGRSEEEVIRKRIDDRKYSDAPNYIIQNNNLNDAVDLIERLVFLCKKSTELSENDLRLYIKNGLLVTDSVSNNIKGASYDLRLGDEYYYRGDIKKLKDQNLRLTIEPYDYALVSSKEEICLPRDVVAHFGLTVGLFCQGIILSNGQQVDPGFRGRLFCLLFNTSNQPVTIKRESHYATIEFTKMNSFASNYKGKYQEKRDIIDVLPANSMQGGISDLKKEIEELKRESRNMQSLYMSVIAIIVAAISILLVLN